VGGTGASQTGQPAAAPQATSPSGQVVPPKPASEGGSTQEVSGQSGPVVEGSKPIEATSGIAPGHRRLIPEAGGAEGGSFDV